MRPVLRALPYFHRPTTASVGTETVEVTSNQIIVWVGVIATNSGTSLRDVRRFPAILDTGHSGTFAIRPSQLRRWTGIEWNALAPEFGYLPLYQGVNVPHRRANLIIFPNQSGWRDEIDPIISPFVLELNEGLAVYGDGEWLGTRNSDRLTGPRLPLLGARALACARLDLRISTARRLVWLDCEAT
jgi:hypothetical protein